MAAQRDNSVTLDAAAYQHLVDQLPDVALIVADRDLRVVLAGGEALPRAGWRAEEMLGHTPRELLPPPVAGLIEEHMAAALRGETTDVPILPGTRSGIVWTTQFRPLRRQGGAVTGVIFLLRDVTRQHLLDERARASERQLRASEQRYRVTLESAASGFANVGLDGRFLRVNRRFCEITGYPEEELLARTYRDITHPDDMELHLALAQQVSSGELPWYSVEKRYIRKDGSVVWVLVTVGALRDDDGRVYEYVDTITDITDRKQAQDEVARVNAELEERVRQRTAELEAFTYTVSHDLRAPLTALSGFVEMLSEEYAGRLGSTGLDYLARIQAASGQMDHLIGDLLSLSQASRAEIHTTRVDLSGLAHTVIAALRHRDPARQVRAVIEDGVQVLGDERLLRTVMDNLLGNAWKFTSATPVATIEFASLPPPGPMVHCYVRDNGAGFDPSSAAQLFRPFSRLHPDEEFPGTGVGLASVQRIVERHHGRCWAEGRPGHGATFHFTLPAAGQASPRGRSGEKP